MNANARPWYPEAVADEADNTSSATGSLSASWSGNRHSHAAFTSVMAARDPPQQRPHSPSSLRLLKPKAALPTSELTRRHNPYALRLSSPNARSTARDVTGEEEEEASSPKTVPSYFSSSTQPNSHADETRTLHLPPPSCRQLPPLSVDAGLGELMTRLTKPMEGQDAEEERLLADEGGLARVPPSSATDSTRASRVAEAEKEPSASQDGDGVVAPSPHDSHFAVAGGAYSPPPVPALEVVKCEPYTSPQLLQEQQREQQRLYLYQAQQERFWQSYNGAITASARTAAATSSPPSPPAAAASATSPALGSSASPSSSPVIAIPMPKGLLRRLRQHQAQETQKGRKVHTHTHNPYGSLTCSDTAEGVTMCSIGVSTNKVSSWPSSAVLREKQQQARQEKAACAAADPLTSSLMIPAPKSQQRKTTPPSSPAAPQAATATTAATSYMAAVVGGARTSVFQSSVPATLVPLPRSRRDDGRDGCVEAGGSGGQGPAAPESREEGGSAGPSARMLAEKTIPSPLCGSNGRLSEVAATHDSGEVTIALSGTATTQTDLHTTNSSRCSDGHDSSTSAVHHPHHHAYAPHGPAAPKALQRPSGAAPKKQKRSSSDDWVLVRGRSTAAGGGGGGISNRRDTTPLHHSSPMFDTRKKSKRQNDGGDGSGGNAKKKLKDAPDRGKTAAVAAKKKKASSKMGEATAAIVEARPRPKDSLVPAKKRKAQQRVEEEAALLNALSAAEGPVEGSRMAADAATGSNALAGLGDVAHNRLATAATATQGHAAGGLFSSFFAAPPACSSPVVCIVNVPLVGLRSLDDLLQLGRTSASTTNTTTTKTGDSSPATPSPTVSLAANVRSLQSLLQRSQALGDCANAKAHLLQRAMGLVTEAVARQAPGLAVAVLLEAADAFLELERSLQCCHRALRLAELHDMGTLEMLARLTVTRTLARAIDTADAKNHLLRAAELALSLGERPALGWVALQMGITLELSGFFTDSLAWYAASRQLAQGTHQPRLLCDVLCCEAIAYYAVGETALAETAHAESVRVLQTLPRCWHPRPLQNFVQLRLQAGDAAGALTIHDAELALAKEHGDAATAARCLGSIALAKKYLGRYEEAAAAYLEELSAQHTPDVRQAVESLTGAASCFLHGGHPKKAREYCRRAVRLAHDSCEPCAVAKAQLELAEVELQDGNQEAARRHVVDALQAMSRVEAGERKQYLVKATLCELEWRCCSTLQRIAVASEPPRLLEALLYSDLCNVPNTANVHHLLRRRSRLYCTATAAAAATPALVKGEADATPAEKAVWPASYLTGDLVSETVLVELLHAPAMRRRKLVCYALPWTEESVCMAFVVSLDSVAASGLSVVGVPLTIPDEAVCLLTNPSALDGVFDAPMTTTDTPSRLLYGDTPLWPQHYSTIAFSYEQALRQQTPRSAKNAAEDLLTGQPSAGATVTDDSPLRTDAMHCLQVLYNAFVRPVEAHVQWMEADRTTPVKGLVFVGDGIVSRIPFHALHDGQTFLTCRFSITTCCSLALLCVLHQAERKRRQEQQQQRQPPPQARSRGLIRSIEVAAVAQNGKWVSPFAAAAADVRGDGGFPAAVTVDHIVVDETGASDVAAVLTATAQEAGKDAGVRHLLEDLKRSCKDKDVSNRLYAAVHASPPVPSGAAEPVESPPGELSCGPRLLDLRVPVVPEVREDFCGFFSASDSRRCVGHSLEVAHTWDLHAYALVRCGGCGTYSGLSIHETGVPVYRSLQYAGAPRLLLPVGSRLPSEHRVAVAAAAAALCADGGPAEGQGRDEWCIADAVQAEQCRCIAAGVPLQDWAAYALCGLP